MSFDGVESKPIQKKIEEVITKIKGVVSCNVVIESQEIQEIHVLASSIRSPKQIVRDIESAVMSQLSIALDHKKISVAQNKEDIPTAKNKRLVIDVVEVKRGRNWVIARVCLRLGDNTYEGICEGPDTELNRHKLLASATIKAIEEMLDRKVMLVVEEFTWQTIADFEVGIVVLSCVSDSRIDNVVGACMVGQGKDFSAVKVVLDALNRKLDVIETT